MTRAAGAGTVTTDGSSRRQRPSFGKPASCPEPVRSNATRDTMVFKSYLSSDPCLAVNGEGVTYREFSCQVPSLEPFYFA